MSKQKIEPWIEPRRPVLPRGNTAIDREIALERSNHTWERYEEVGSAIGVVTDVLKRAADADRMFVSRTLDILLLRRYELKDEYLRQWGLVVEEPFRVVESAGAKVGDDSAVWIGSADDVSVKAVVTS